MVERRPLLTLLSHLTLILGVMVVCFPIYLTVIASTQTAQQIAQSHPLSLLPGGHGLANWKIVIFGGKSEMGDDVPSALPMLRISLLSSLLIALGKIAISLL